MSAKPHKPHPQNFREGDPRARELGRRGGIASAKTNARKPKRPHGGFSWWTARAQPDQRDEFIAAAAQRHEERLAEQNKHQVKVHGFIGHWPGR